MVVFIRDSSKVPTFDAGHDASSSPPRFPGTVTRTLRSPSLPPSRQRVEKPRSKPRARPPPTLRNRVSDRNIDLVLALHFCELCPLWHSGGRETQSGTVGTVSDDAWMEERCLSSKDRRGTKLGRSTLFRVEKRWVSVKYAWTFLERLMILKKKSIDGISIGGMWNGRIIFAILILVLKIWDRRVVNFWKDIF